MVGAAVLAGQVVHDNTSIWLILAPYMTLVVAVIGLAVAFYPQWKDHRKNQHLRERREERIDATCDAVLGCTADLQVGKVAQEGLVSQVTAIKRVIGPMNGTGKNLVQLHEEGNKVSTDLARKFDEHLRDDKQEFEKIWKTIENRT